MHRTPPRSGRRPGALAAVLAALVALASPALAQAPTAAAPAAPASALDRVLAAGVLRVGTTGDYRPFTAKDKATGAFAGYDLEQADALAKALGVRLEVVETSWPNLMKDFEAGKYDVGMGGISVTLDRAKKAFFSAPYLREGKTPIARCSEVAKFQTLADIDKPGVRAVVNPGGTNERFAKANLKAAEIRVHPDNLTIFDEIAAGRADLMMTDSSETRFQQKQHPGVLCAIHPDSPFDFAEKAYLLPRDEPLKQFVDQWMRLEQETGRQKTALSRWLD